MSRLRGRQRVEVTPYRPRRSDRQLRYYWPCCVAPFAKWLHEENGEHFSKDLAHETLKSHFLTAEVVNKETGEVLGRRVKHTDELDTAEFTRYIDDCRNFLAEYCNIITQDPDPNWNLKQSNVKP